MNEERSIKVQEALAEKPSWAFRNGLGVLACCLAVFIVASNFIRVTTVEKATISMIEPLSAESVLCSIDRRITGTEVILIHDSINMQIKIINRVSDAGLTYFQTPQSKLISDILKSKWKISCKLQKNISLFKKLSNAFFKKLH